jgi:curved DNA-binding protein CbpA
MGDPPTNRPAPAANGTLEKTPLIHLVLYALQNGLTGTVELWAPGERRAGILFLSGQPAKTYTSEPISYLGAIMNELGYLSEDGLARSLDDLAQAKSRGPALHGQLLLQARVIDEKMLLDSLQHQVAQKLRHVSTFPPESVYAYYELFDGLRGWGSDMSEGFDPVPMIWAMLQANPPHAHLNSALANVGALPVRLGRNANMTRLGLAPRHLAAIERLRERALRVADLVTGSGLAESEARLLVYLLLVTRQIDVLRPSDGHPSGSHGAARMSPFPPIVAEAVQAVRSKTPSSPMPGPARTSSPARNSSTTTPAATSPGGSTGLTQRADEIVRRAAIIDQSDYFAMLDVPRDATLETVQASFFALAKKWHPDRLPPELAHVRDACSRVFARMSEAHSTLIDASKRENYALLLADGSGSPETQDKVAKVIDAATNFQKAEVCLKRGDHSQAEVLCRLALEADSTQSDYLAMMAWLQALKPENQSPEKTAQSLVMLTEAIKINGRCEKAYFWRGMLLRRLGKAEAAMRDFKEAVELNPRNIDAAREVRLYRMRGGRFSTSPPKNKAESGAPPRRSSPLPAKPDESKPRLLDRFFKK